MSYPQPQRPRPRRPERTPSTDIDLPIPESAPAATLPASNSQLRFPFSPEPSAAPPSAAPPSYRPPHKPGSVAPSHRTPGPPFSPVSASPSSRPRPPFSKTPAASTPPPGSPFGPGLARVTSHDASPIHPPLADGLQDVPLSSEPRGGQCPPDLPPPPTACSRFSDASIAERLKLGAHYSKWPKLVQWVILPSILVISAAVTILMAHSLGLYGGLKLGGTIDYTTDTHPMWPAGLNLIPTFLLLGVGFSSFCCSIIVWGLSLRERFMKPVKGLEGFRLGASIFFIGAWAGGLVVFKLFQRSDDGDSLGYWSCQHEGERITGVGDFKTACTEQTTGFALGVTSAALEVAMIGCFAVRTVLAKNRATMSVLDDKSRA